jgi:hypothetical protein
MARTGPGVTLDSAIELSPTLDLERGGVLFPVGRLRESGARLGPLVKKPRKFIIHVSDIWSCYMRLTDGPFRASLDLDCTVPICSRTARAVEMDPDCTDSRTANRRTAERPICIGLFIPPNLIQEVCCVLSFLGHLLLCSFVFPAHLRGCLCRWTNKRLETNLALVFLD